MTNKLIAIAVFAIICSSLLVGENEVGYRNELQRMTFVFGKVKDESGPIAGATVRIKGTNNSTTTDQNGRFKISGFIPDSPVVLTASASGYYIGGGIPHHPGKKSLIITLKKHPQKDNPDYQWLPPRPLPDQPGKQGCAECHSGRGTQLTFSLPVEEWLDDAHSKSTRNERFLTMYEGTDVMGRAGYGPGYRLDNRNSEGICSTCHAPAAAINAPYTTDPGKLIGIFAEGIICDFCHKISEVKVNPTTRLPNSDAPGVLSMDFRRPPDGHQFFAGPLDDVAPFEDVYLPLYRESRFCAPCHYGVFEGTTIYNSYGEWLDTPYADTDTGKTCQDCHMAPSGTLELPETGTTIQWGSCSYCHKMPDGRTFFAKQDKGAVSRDSQTVFSHRMPGAADHLLLQNAVSMQLTANHAMEGRIVAEVNITNDKTGHDVPTDSPLRQMLLLVRAKNTDGTLCQLVEGSALPAWCGSKNGMAGHYAGLPGKAFAKILQDVTTGIVPSVAYWNQTRVVSDNRLAAMTSDLSKYTFVCTDPGAVTVEARLLYRRAFVDLMDTKGWKMPDILMEEQALTLQSGANEPVTSP